MIEILYEDHDIIICVKPAGMLSEDDGTDCSIVTHLRVHTCGYIGTVHRLDRAVGGVMVYSKNQQITGKLSAALADSGVGKEYLAVIRGTTVEPSGIYKDLLFKDSQKNKSYVVGRARKGVKEAELEYETVSIADDGVVALSLIKVKLHSGRTHQIRVQFASRKTPLLGDGKYGSSDNRCGVALWSHSLTLRHPTTRKVITATKTPPDKFPWNIY